MGIFYAGLSISFIILFVINIIWVAVNLYLWSMNGIQYLLEGMNFAERVYGSILLKWILLADLIWIILALLVMQTGIVLILDATANSGMKGAASVHGSKQQ